MNKCICSKLIEEGAFIEIPRTNNPGRAKSFNIKRRHAIFYPDNSGRYQIPKRAEIVSFPDYHEYNKNVNYGIPCYK